MKIFLIIIYFGIGIAMFVYDTQLIRKFGMNKKARATLCFTFLIYLFLWPVIVIKESIQ